MRSALSIVLIILIAGAEQTDRRIDLAEFGRVVQYTGSTPETLQAKTLERGMDGWETWKGPDGQAMIGLEFDAPRDLAEVGIEFRHAIARRYLIQVQYFRSDWPDAGKGNPAKADASHGEWVTAKAEWWAGDRDVNFAFVPYNQEQPGPNAPDYRYRRTRRLRFLLGDRELPPVRYLHAFGSKPCADGNFDVRLDAGSAAGFPLDLSVTNGYFLEGKFQEPSLEMSLYRAPASFTVRYAHGDLETPTRTVVSVRAGASAEQGASFMPDEAALQGSIHLPAMGATIVCHGATVASQAVQSQPTTESSALPPERASEDVAADGLSAGHDG